MPKHFIELPPQTILDAIEGHEDVLTPALDKELERVTSLVCSDCGEASVARVHPEIPFVEGRALPVYVPFCPKCLKYL